MTSRSYGGGVQGFYENITKALVIKRVTMGSEGVKNSVTSFMDDPIAMSFIKNIHHTNLPIFTGLINYR